VSPDADGLLAPLAAPPDVVADALPVALEPGFCSWVVEDGLCAPCESCFFSCATAPDDSMAAATAAAIRRNFIKISFPGNTDSVDC
jgi:hypothetical protein